jgi:hypothetical protein
MLICWHKLCLTLLEIELVKELKVINHHYFFLEFVSVFILLAK